MSEEFILKIKAEDIQKQVWNIQMMNLKVLLIQ